MEKEKAFPTIERYSFAEKCIHPLPSPPPHRKMQLMRRFAGMKSRRKTEGGVRTVNRGPNLYLRWYYFSKRRDGNKGGGKKKCYYLGIRCNFLLRRPIVSSSANFSTFSLASILLFPRSPLFSPPSSIKM